MKTLYKVILFFLFIFPTSYYSTARVNRYNKQPNTFKKNNTGNNSEIPSPYVNSESTASSENSQYDQQYDGYQSNDYNNNGINKSFDNQKKRSNSVINRSSNENLISPVFSLKRDYSKDVHVLNQSLTLTNAYINPEEAVELFAINDTQKTLDTIKSGSSQALVLDVNSTSWTDKLINVILRYIPDFSMASSISDINFGANIDHINISRHIGLKGDFTQNNMTTILVQSSPIQINRKVELNFVAGSSITNHQFENNHSYHQFRIICQVKASLLKVIDNSAFSFNYYQIAKGGKLINFRFFCFFLGVFNFIFNITYKTIEGKNYLIISIGGSNIFNLLYLNCNFVIDIQDVATNLNFKNVLRNTVPQISTMLIFISPNLKNVEQMTSNFIYNDLFFLQSVEAQEDNVVAKAFNKAIQNNNPQALTKIISSMKTSVLNPKDDIFIKTNPLEIKKKGKQILNFLNFLIKFDNNIDKTFQGDIESLSQSYDEYLYYIAIVNSNDKRQRSYKVFEKIVEKYQIINDKIFLLQNAIKQSVGLKTLDGYMNNTFAILENNIIDLLNSCQSAFKEFSNIIIDKENPEYKLLKQVFDLNSDLINKHKKEGDFSQGSKNVKKIPSHYDTEAFQEIYQKNEEEYLEFKTKLYDNIHLFFYLFNRYFEYATEEHNKIDYKFLLRKKFNGDLYLTSKKDNYDLILSKLVDDKTHKFDYQKLDNAFKNSLTEWEKLLNRPNSSLKSLKTFCENLKDNLQNDKVDKLTEMANLFNQIIKGLHNTFVENEISDIIIYISEINRSVLRDISVDANIIDKYDLKFKLVNIFYQNNSNDEIIFNSPINNFLLFMIKNDISIQNIENVFSIKSAEIVNFNGFLNKYVIDKKNVFQKDFNFERLSLHDIKVKEKTTDIFLTLENIQYEFEKFKDGENLKNIHEFNFKFDLFRDFFVKNTTSDHIRQQYVILIKLNNAISHLQDHCSNLALAFFDQNNFINIKNAYFVLYQLFRVNLLNLYWSKNNDQKDEFYLTVLKELLIYKNIFNKQYNIDNWNEAIKTVKSKDKNMIDQLKDLYISEIQTKSKIAITTIDGNLKIEQIIINKDTYLNHQKDYFKYDKTKNTLDTAHKDKLPILNAATNQIISIITQYNDFFDKDLVENDKPTIIKKIMTFYDDKLKGLETVFDLTKQNFTDEKNEFQNTINENLTSVILYNDAISIKALMNAQQTDLDQVIKERSDYLNLTNKTNVSTISEKITTYKSLINSNILNAIFTKLMEIEKTLQQFYNQYQQQIDNSIKELTNIVNQLTTYENLFKNYQDVIIDFDYDELKQKQNYYQNADTNIKTLHKNIIDIQNKIKIAEGDLQNLEEDLNKLNIQLKNKADEINQIIIEIKKTQNKLSQINYLESQQKQLEIEKTDLNKNIYAKKNDIITQKTAINQLKNNTSLGSEGLKQLEEQQESENKKKSYALREFDEMKQNIIKNILESKYELQKKNFNELKNKLQQFDTKNFTSSSKVIAQLDKKITEMGLEQDKITKLTIDPSITDTPKKISILFNSEIQTLQQLFEDLLLVEYQNIGTITIDKNKLSNINTANLEYALSNIYESENETNPLWKKNVTAFLFNSKTYLNTIEKSLLFFNSITDKLQKQKITVDKTYQTKQANITMVKNNYTESVKKTNIKILNDLYQKKYLSSSPKEILGQMLTESQKSLEEYSKNMFLIQIFSDQVSDFDDNVKSLITSSSVQTFKSDEESMMFLQNMSSEFSTNLVKDNVDTNFYIPNIGIQRTFKLYNLPQKPDPKKKKPNNNIVIPIQDMVMVRDTINQYKSLDGILYLNKNWTDLDSNYFDNKTFTLLKNDLDVKQIFFSYSSCFLSDAKDLVEALGKIAELLNLNIKEEGIPSMANIDVIALNVTHSDMNYPDPESIKTKFKNLYIDAQKIAGIIPNDNQNSGKKDDKEEMNLRYSLFQFINGIELRSAHFIGNNTQDIGNLIREMRIENIGSLPNQSSGVDLKKIGKDIGKGLKNFLLDLFESQIKKKMEFFLNYYKTGCQPVDLNNITKPVFDILSLIFVKLTDVEYVQNIVKDNSLLITKDNQGHYVFANQSLEDKDPKSPVSNLTADMLKNFSEVMAILEKENGKSDDIFLDSAFVILLKSIAPYLKKALLFLNNGTENGHLTNTIIDVIISINSAQQSPNLNINSMIAQIYSGKSSNELLFYCSPYDLQTFRKADESDTIWESVSNLKDVFKDSYTLKDTLNYLIQTQENYIDRINSDFGIFPFMNHQISYINNLLYLTNEIKNIYCVENNNNHFNKYSNLYDNLLGEKTKILSEFKKQIIGLKGQNYNFNEFLTIINTFHTEIKQIIDKHDFKTEPSGEAYSDLFNTIINRGKRITESSIRTSMENSFNGENIKQQLQNYKLLFYSNSFYNFMALNRFIKTKYPSFKPSINLDLVYKTFRSLQDSIAINTADNSNFIMLPEDGLGYTFSLRGADLKEFKDVDKDNEKNNYLKYAWIAQESGKKSVSNINILTSPSKDFSSAENNNGNSVVGYSFESVSKASVSGHNNIFNIFSSQLPNKIYDPAMLSFIKQLHSSKTVINGYQISEIIYKEDGTINILVFFQVFFNSLKDFAKVEDTEQENNLIQKIRNIKNKNARILSLVNPEQNALIKQFNGTFNVIQEDTITIHEFLDVLNLFLTKGAKSENFINFISKFFNLNQILPKVGLEVVHEYVNIQELSGWALNSKFSMTRNYFLSFIEILGKIQINLSKNSDRIQKNLFLLWGLNNQTPKDYYKLFKDFNNLLLNLSVLELNHNSYTEVITNANYIVQED